MSNALAIAAVTAVLRDLLVKGLAAYKIAEIVEGDVLVSAVPPDRIDITRAEELNQLNLFLYQTTFNQGWRNAGLPTRNSNGDRVDDNPLALNLHYLLSAYGSKVFYPEIILGHAMQLLHETPVLTRDAIREALQPDSDPPDWPKALATSELADQVEQLRITPEILNPEEISKLWAAIQAHYRPTAVYQVTVVLIESKRPTKSALPVAGRNVYVVPFEQPVIDSVTEDSGDTAPITAGSTLLVTGRGLRGEINQVLVGGIDLTSSVSDLRETQIILPLPGQLPTGLRSGIQTLQVVHMNAMGTPEVEHSGVESNVASFVLRPLIKVIELIGVVDSKVDDVIVWSGKVQITFNPKVGKTQRVVLFLNELNPPPNMAPRAYSFKAPPGNGITDPHTETPTVEIAFANVIPATYLLRVKVDGAESLLGVDGGGTYATPQVKIP